MVKKNHHRGVEGHGGKRDWGDRAGGIPRSGRTSEPDREAGKSDVKKLCRDRPDYGRHDDGAKLTRRGVGHPNGDQPCDTADDRAARRVDHRAKVGLAEVAEH